MTSIRTGILAALCLVCCGTGCTAERVDVQLGPKGLSSLKAAGQDLLADGRVRVTGCFIRRLEGSTYAADLTGGKVTVDAGDNRATVSYPWGSVSATYRTAAGRLDMLVEVTNASESDTIAALHLQLMALRLPSEPKFLLLNSERSQPPRPLGEKACIGSNMNADPTVIHVDYGTGSLALCNEELARALALGFAPPADKGKQQSFTCPVLAYTGRHALMPKAGDLPFIDRPVHPRQTQRWRLSLRFGPAGASLADLAGDFFPRFAEAYPFRMVDWKDRRPIGRVFIANGGSPTNPRSWVFARKIDYSTPAGKTEFKKALLAYADRIIAICKEISAQGIIVWDLEGVEFRNAKYMGDPRSMPPEMEHDGAVDAFLQRFRDAGLRIGLTIRPQLLMTPPYKHQFLQVRIKERRHRVALLAAKIAHAKKRWGVTIFYLDSNSLIYDDPKIADLPRDFSWHWDADMLRQVTAQHPDVLIVPEHKGIQQYAYGAPYIQVNHHQYAATPGHVLRTYPKAFSVLQAGGKLDERRDELVQAVRHGDILFFDAWYPSADNSKVKKIYQDAAK